jgi:hypothetical protein
MTPISIDEGRIGDRLWVRLSGGLWGRNGSRFRSRPWGGLWDRLRDRILDLYSRTLTHDSDID